MKLVREFVSSESMSASEVWNPRGFSSDRPTQSLVLGVDEVITSGTAGSGAYNQDSPWSILKQLIVRVNGLQLFDVAGYLLAKMQNVDFRTAAWYNRTTWAISAALDHDMALRLDFIRPLKPGDFIEVQLKAGSVAERVNTVTPTLTSSQWTLYQDCLEEVSPPQMKKIKENPFYRSLVSQLQVIAAAATSGWNELIIPTGDAFAGILCRVLDNSLLNDALVTELQWEYEKSLPRKAVTKEVLKEEWQVLTRQAAVTGYFYVSPDLDGDGVAILRTSSGKTMKLRFKNGAPTGTASIEVLYDKWVRVAG